MKIARIFRHSDGLIYVCDDAAPGLDARGEGLVSKAEAMRAARAQGFTHAKGSGTYQGNKLTDLAHPFDLEKFLFDKRRRKAASETHTQLDLGGAE